MIHGATRIATHVASRVGKAIGFDEILSGGDAGQIDSAASNDEPQEVDVSFGAPALRDRLTEQIRSLLKDAGIQLNQELQLSVDQQKNFRVETQHSHAAEIESVLNGDSMLKSGFEQLARLEKRNDFSIDLTSSDAPATMFAPGGYPNW